MNIEEIIRPENITESLLINEKEFIEGALFGKPRRGHPEGKVILHIREVLDNIDKFASKEDREKLRIIAILHDTFKHKVSRDKPRHGENHHAMIARRFAEKFIQEESILDIIELHDEAYNCWCHHQSKFEDRINRLINRLGDNLDLYMTFYKCDSETGDKRQTPYVWFEEYVKTNINRVIEN